MSSAEYLGIPYKLGGRNRDGIDCWGLARLVLREQFGRDLPEIGTDSASMPPQEAARLMADGVTVLGLVRVETPEPGDITLFRIAGHPAHVGVVVQPGWFLHITQGAEVTLERLDSTRWIHRIEGFYRGTSTSLCASIQDRPD